MSFKQAPGIDLKTHALFLDLDGTLAPFEIHPSLVGPDARRSSILRQLQGLLDGRIAIVSGRRISDIDRILGREVLAVAGAHGLERRTPGGQTQVVAPHSSVGRAHEALLAVAADHPGVLLEMKGLSIALHYRARPELAERLSLIAAEISRSTGLGLQAGDKVLELLTPGPDKGDAVRAFMSEPPFVGTRAVYVGDDLTDESAFQAVRALGGFGVLVGPPRATAASYRLAGVEEVLEWLEGQKPYARQQSEHPEVACLG
jgi:trehalose 6-phosphate phosphatase